METKKRDTYTEITSIIINHLESGIIPWRKKWNKYGLATNIYTKQMYSGLNLFFLNIRGFESNLFGTFKQIANMGGSVKKGEKGTKIFFWKPMEKKPQEGDEEIDKPRFVLRSYTVFNFSQTKGMEINMEDFPPSYSGTPIEIGERIIKEFPFPPAIDYNGIEACYSPKLDIVSIPPRKSFVDAESFYSILFHELVHSTGHAKRLSRKGIAVLNTRDVERYSEEELIAELGASFLCGHTGIVQDNFQHNAAYIQSWLKVFQNDQRILLRAAGKAQKAVNHILGKAQAGGNRE